MADNIKIGRYHYSDFNSCRDSINSIESISCAHGIVVPEKFISIGEISDCTGMIIPDTIISIGVIKYSSLIIPASVESITEIVGYGDDSRRLTVSGSHVINISLKSKIPPMIGCVTNLSKLDSLMVPQGALNAYKNHPIWGKFKNILENPRLNSLTPNTTGTTTSSNNDEIAEIRNEIFELRNEIADLKNMINNPKNMNSESNSVLGLFSKLFEK